MLNPVNRSRLPGFSGLLLLGLGLRGLVFVSDQRLRSRRSFGFRGFVLRGFESFRIQLLGFRVEGRRGAIQCVRDRGGGIWDFSTGPIGPICEDAAFVFPICALRVWFIRLSSVEPWSQDELATTRKRQ